MIALLTAAFAAGMVATANPCGFAMLPAYLGYFLGAKEGAVTPGRLATVAGSVSAGFVVVFAAAGTLITLGLRSVISVLPWLAAAVGVGLVVLGIGMLGGKIQLPGLPAPGRANKAGTTAGMFAFGVSYAIASLSCTLPIFLSLVAGALAGDGLLESVAAFLSYGLGMALVLTAITVAVGLGRQRLVHRIQALGKHMRTISGIVLLLSGAFIVWYWATVLSAGAETLGGSGIVRAVDRMSSAIANFASEQVGLLVGAVVVVLVLGIAALSSKIRDSSS